MIIILSPAKTLNMELAKNTDTFTKPQFIKEAGLLMKELRKYSPPEMEGLLKISSQLAEQSFKKHIRWTEDSDLYNAKQAVLAYDGAVYQGIDSKCFNEAQLLFANNHLRILSALYGALRPLDLIQPYRLEMQTKLKYKQNKNLYDFWGKKLTEYLKKELHEQKDNIIVDLASKEYSEAIDLKKLNAKVITPIFKEYKNGSLKMITIYAKRARGLMSRYIIENEIDNADELKEFDAEGYTYNEYMSDLNKWVFTRHSINS